jgi:hypothetical protein
MGWDELETVAGARTERLAGAIQAGGAQEHTGGGIDLSGRGGVTRDLCRIGRNDRNAPALQQRRDATAGHEGARNQEQCPRCVVIELTRRHHREAYAGDGGEHAQNGVSLLGGGIHDRITQTTICANYTASSLGGRGASVAGNPGDRLWGAGRSCE